MVFELQHWPPTHVSPGLHLFIGWHAHPSDPAAHSVGSTEPVAPAGITHFPEVQTPLAQSGPVEQVVFGSVPAGGRQSPLVHVPLWQSLACLQCEPAGEAPPELEPPFDVEPPAPLDPPPPSIEP
jgi:hypothetical protein